MHTVRLRKTGKTVNTGQEKEIFPKSWRMHAVIVVSNSCDIA
jgi:hypothetical protein